MTELITPLIDELELNPINDRHGPLPNDVLPIDWMLKNKNKEIKKLAADIVKNKKVYEILLVQEKNGKYIVWDGNRRTSALKLLDNPSLAKDPSTKKYFEDLSKQLKVLPTISCQVETNIDVINNILERRHSGKQDGIGQDSWGTNEKHNFRKRTGKEKPHVGHAVRDLLLENGLLQTKDKVKTSSIDKVLSTESLRNRVGISYKDGILYFTHEEKEVLKTLLKIAKDTEHGNLTLTKLLKAKDKTRYINDLEKGGFLPSTKTRLDDARKMEASSIKYTDQLEKQSVAVLHPPRRKHLIRKTTKYNLGNDPELHRFQDVWNELQFKLNLDDHINSISVLERVLIEFAVKYYNTQNGVQFREKDSLADKIEKAANKMHGQRLIDQKYQSKIVAFAKDKELLSTKTLNSFVHSTSDFPDKDTVIAIWDNLELFILKCIEGKDQTSQAA